LTQSRQERNGAMWRPHQREPSSTREIAKVKSLSRYFSVAKDERPAKFMIARKLSANFDEEDTIGTLWQKHTALTRKFYEFEKSVDNDDDLLKTVSTPAKSYLDLKIEITKRILKGCHLCARRCAVDRSSGELGYCRCGVAMRVSSIFEHMGEEPELIPSGTVFTMGCTIRCKHCQNWTISQWEEEGVTLEHEELARKVEQLRSNGCRNINLVGGEPTPWLLEWLKVFKLVKSNVPVVWNSNTYYSPETARLLAGFIDVYLLDFKYGPKECATRISDAPSYWEVCTFNHLEARKYGEVLVRVLVLPEHLECCTKPVLNWIAEKLGKDTRVNVMFQYRPEWRAFEVPELRRRLTGAEMNEAVQIARETGLQDFMI
jgi:putative pyruvate formate lyase activating enzyme